MRIRMMALVLAAGWACVAGAQEQEMEYGELEYLNSCAVCHGADGRGHGPLAPELRTRPADLTLLSKRNGDRFPYQRVHAIVDGRYVVPGHGDREMPVWGRRFLEEDAEVYGDDGEFVTTERIHELTGYLESIQR